MLGMCALLVRSTGVLLCGRLVSGVVSGMYSTIIPVYTCETTPKSQQGMYGCIYHLQLPIGITTTFALGTLLPSPNQPPPTNYLLNHWTYCMIIFPAILILIKFLLFLFIFTQDTPYDMLK